MIELLALAAIDISLPGLVSIVITMLIAGCVIGLLYYLITIVPIREPYKEWILIAFKVLVVLFIIGLLLSFAGFPIVHFK
jgi:hypothetical protein